MNSIIDEIVQEMLKVLDNSQLIQLKRVLKKNLGIIQIAVLKKAMNPILQII